MDFTQMSQNVTGDRETPQLKPQSRQQTPLLTVFLHNHFGLVWHHNTDAKISKCTTATPFFESCLIAIELNTDTLDHNHTFPNPHIQLKILTESSDIRFCSM